jgi:hypothetical protein
MEKLKVLSIKYEDTREFSPTSYIKSSQDKTRQCISFMAWDGFKNNRYIDATHPTTIVTDQHYELRRRQVLCLCHVQAIYFD